jgi:hypothetical protein
MYVGVANEGVVVYRFMLILDLSRVMKQVGLGLSLVLFLYLAFIVIRQRRLSGTA